VKLKQVGLVVCATSSLYFCADAARAGEITGNGDWIAGDPDAPLNGNSECAYSGREDDPSDPFFRGDIAQSWGQIYKALRDTLPPFLHPGVACNPQRSQDE
jgi:hypothetical protein